VDVLICQILHHFKLGRTLRCIMSQQEHFRNMGCVMYADVEVCSPNDATLP
jgi:hypothetical protein